uniref:xaa-Pro aminopeptidase 2 isoform X3 n=1 Tax=Myxine glutinosa TaxID=7769 RepID=UPI00358E326A
MLCEQHLDLGKWRCGCKYCASLRCSEYIAPKDARLAWMTGFTGSAGTAVITGKQAAIWTDSRYWIQVERQVDCNWELQKTGGISGMVKWITQQMEDGGRVGFDPYLFSISGMQKWQSQIERINITLNPIETNLVDIIWGTDRPGLSNDSIYILRLEQGQTWKEKVSNIREQMANNFDKPTALLLCSLDDTAWLLNLRCDDIPFSPFFFAYTLLTLDEIMLYVHSEKVSSDVREYLSGAECPDCVKIRNYSSVALEIAAYSKNDVHVWVGREFTNYALYTVVPKEKLILDPFTPVQLTKAVKDPTEQKSLKDAHIRDAVAMVQFLSWLEEKVPEGLVDEISAQQHVDMLRSKQKYAKGPSFETISASGLNAALAHYVPGNETKRPLMPNEMYLIDSGGQYLDGTTDITRTLHWGTPTDFQKEAYTRVLRGNLDLRNAIFQPEILGTRLDFLARQSLWEVGLNYGHGTGHGIGNFLCVHEWPVGIASTYDTNLKEGMFTSIEPGYYEDNEFGVRLEDIAMVTKAKTKYMFGGKPYLTFDTVSLVPYDKRLIDTRLLSDTQIAQLNAYYETIREKVGNELQAQGLQQEKEWLMHATEPFVSGSSKVTLPLSHFGQFLLTLFTVMITSI